MSRIGKLPITVPAGVEVKLDGREISAWYYQPRGPRQLSLDMSSGLTAKPMPGPVIVAVHGGPEGQEHGMDLRRGSSVVGRGVLGALFGLFATLSVEAASPNAPASNAAPATPQASTPRSAVSTISASKTALTL